MRSMSYTFCVKQDDEIQVGCDANNQAERGCASQLTPLSSFLRSTEITGSLCRTRLLRRAAGPGKPPLSTYQPIHVHTQSPPRADFKFEREA